MWAILELVRYERVATSWVCHNGRALGTAPAVAVHEVPLAPQVMQKCRARSGRETDDTMRVAPAGLLVRYERELVERDEDGRMFLAGQ